MTDSGFSQRIADSLTAVRLHLRLPLYRNGYALLFNGAATSALGMLYWILAARFYSTTAVGLNSAAISAMLLLSGMAQLSFSGLLVRFIPMAGGLIRRFSLSGYAIAIAVSVAVGVVFTAGAAIWAPALITWQSTPLAAMSFVLALVIWTIFTLQDSVMTGLRQAIWVPVENTLFAIAKIILLMVLAGPLPSVGIFASWIIPVGISLLPVNWLIFWRLVPANSPLLNNEPAPGLVRQSLTYVIGNYPASLFSLASTALLPLIVVNVAGARLNAIFYLPWTIASGLQLVAANMALSLTVEAAHDGGKFNQYCYDVFVQIIRFLLPAVGLILVLADYLLKVFGAEYAAGGAALLRWLAISTLPNVLVVLYLAMARVRNRVVGIIVAQATICLVGLGLSYMLLPRYGLPGVGMAWLISQTFAATAAGLMGMGAALVDGRKDYVRNSTARSTGLR